MSGYRFQTLPGPARAFRHWALSADLTVLPDVPGANARERRLLGALGGLACAVADPRHIEGWPAQLREWAHAAPRPPEELTDGVRSALVDRDREDPLASLSDASTSANRRRLGTVFTPRELVDHMISLAATEVADAGPACVIDPGAGVGAFTIAPARRWPLAQIVAVDINPVTLGLLACRISFEIEAYPETAACMERIELILADYLGTLPDHLDCLAERISGQITPIVLHGDMRPAASRKAHERLATADTSGRDWCLPPAATSARASTTRASTPRCWRCQSPGREPWSSTRGGFTVPIRVSAKRSSTTTSMPKSRFSAACSPSASAHIARLGTSWPRSRKASQRSSPPNRPATQDRKSRCGTA